MTTPKFNPAFNSVVFLLTVLAMFSHVTLEVVKAMKLLLEVAYHYNYLLQREVPMNEDIYNRALECFDVLAILAEQRGYPASSVDKNRMTMEDMRDMLGVIVLPLLHDRTDDELLELEMTTRSGGEILIMPLDQVRLLVRLWTQAQRGEAISKDELDRFGLDFKPGSLEWESEMSRVELWESGGADCSDEERDVKLGIDPRTKPKRAEAWSNVRMDEQTAIAVATHCSSYAAGLTETTLRRKNRTGKVAGRCHGTLYAIVEQDEAGYDPTATTIENKDGSLWIIGEDPSEMLIPVTSSQDSVTAEVEVTEWSDGEDMVEWDMMPFIAKGKKPDVENVPENIVEWHANEGHTEWDTEQKQAHEYDLEQPQGYNLEQSRSDPTLGSLHSEEVSPPVDATPPVAIAREARATREMPIHVDDIFGVVQLIVSSTDGQMSADDNVTGEPHMPPTPLKHSQSGFDEEIWAGHSGVPELLAREDSGDLADDDGIVWSMVDIAEGTRGNMLLAEHPEQESARQQSRMKRLALALEEAESTYEVVSPLTYRSQSQGRADMLSNMEEFSAVDPQSPSRISEATSSDNHDLDEIQMPPTPLKHSRQDSNRGHWSGYPANNPDRVDYHCRPEDALESGVESSTNNDGLSELSRPRALMEDDSSDLDPEARNGPTSSSDDENNQPGTHAPNYPMTDNDIGEIVLPRTPLKHNRHSFGFGFGLWTVTGNHSSNYTSNRAGPSGSAGLDTTLRTEAPDAPMDAPDSGPLAMPPTPLKHNHDSFDHNLWGLPIDNLAGTGSQAGLLEQSETTAETSELEVNGAPLPNFINTSGAEDMEMPSTPLKHNQGEFDYSIWPRTSLGNLDDTATHELSAISGPNIAQAGPSSETIEEVTNLNEVSEPTTNESNSEAGPSLPASDIPVPSTPLKHYRGESGEDLWTRGFDAASAQSVTEPSATRPLRIVTRKHGTRDLRAASLAAEEPNTPVLANEPVEERIADDSSDTASEVFALCEHTEVNVADRDYSSNVAVDEPTTPPRLVLVGSASATSSDSCLPLTPVAQEFSYPMSKITEEYCKEMVSYWETEVQEKWKVGIALWNEEDCLPEPTLKPRQRGVVRRLAAALELIGQ